MDSQRVSLTNPALSWPEIPGFIHYEQERYEQFLEWAERGLAREPESLAYHEHRFIYRSLHGQWKGAWADWEYRSSRQKLLAKFRASHEWTGQHLPGKTLLVIGEGGLGDHIMFSRWLEKTRLSSNAEKLVFLTRPELCRWFNRRWVNQHPWLIVTTDPETLPPYDVWSGLESLPHKTGIPEPFPAGTVKQAANVRKVGICWHGGPGASVDKKRSTDLAMWSGILNTKGICFRSLQYGEYPEAPLEPLGPVADMADTADRIADLDLVITVDTSVAHLAATIGVPVWMLHYRAPEWRWGVAGESTVWYPSMRIFRQERRGEWEPVFQRVLTEIKSTLRK